MSRAEHSVDDTAATPMRRSGGVGRVLRAVGTLMNWLLLAALGAIVGGFIFFVYSIHQTNDPTSFPDNAGIVAFTGASGRIEKGLKLLGEGKGERLLISGVHPDNGLADLAAQHRGYPKLFECCIDLDAEALDTAGNARETLAWADKNGFDALIIVTSDWHLPRSLLELRQANGDQTLIGAPVQTDVISEGILLSNSETLRLLAQEYAKYLFAMIRNVVPGPVGSFAAAHGWPL
ncbi:YdcF family protein [Notoacmeibacter sp. MSK16QG-6]|uniref:YdcF family protein n=1 Tax=Notoacmeibacter sp. MSK16QG-6 TaxID=2957982 RepID=UPI00209F30C4|nr:YdcF family protein [Notoacmeibacter sp. MSK16QG-6]MCP1199984.1 YdcF family protein [Notoacmeibacter sp. MSK16QG-6]